MNVFCEIIDNIYRLKFPFDTVYTSVFLIKTSTKPILIDCGSNAYDVDNFIIPALRELGVDLCDLSSVVVTHSHSDHAGGLERILEIFPGVRIISKEEYIDNERLIYPLAGHTKDCIGVFDLRTCTLISGDGLQGAGVDKYKCSLASKDEYLKTLEKIKADERIENILFTHAYEPWNRDYMFGRESVLECIEECKKYIGEK